MRTNALVTLDSVSLIINRGGRRSVLLENISWTIRPHERIVILAPPDTAGWLLFDIISGFVLPTSGWVKLRGSVSVPNGLLRYALQDTTRQLIVRLSRLYGVNADEVLNFISGGLASEGILDVRPRLLSPALRNQLNLILTLALPYDFYLLPANFAIIGNARFQSYCEYALKQRMHKSGLIVRAGSAGQARQLDPSFSGAIFNRGNLLLYKSLADAISVFESLGISGSAGSFFRRETAESDVNTEETFF